MRYVIYPSNCCSSNEKGRPRVSNRSAHFFLPLPQMTTVLKSIAKKERFHLPAEVSEMIVSESNGNLRKALLVFEALKMQSWVPSPLSSLFFSHLPPFIPIAPHYLFPDSINESLSHRSPHLLNSTDRNAPPRTTTLLFLLPPSSFSPLSSLPSCTSSRHLIDLPPS